MGRLRGVCPAVVISRCDGLTLPLTPLRHSEDTRARARRGERVTTAGRVLLSQLRVAKGGRGVGLRPFVPDMHFGFEQLPSQELRRTLPPAVAPLRQFIADGNGDTCLKRIVCVLCRHRIPDT